MYASDAKVALATDFIRYTVQPVLSNPASDDDDEHQGGLSGADEDEEIEEDEDDPPTPLPKHAHKSIPNKSQVKLNKSVKSKPVNIAGSQNTLEYDAALMYQIDPHPDDEMLDPVAYRKPALEILSPLVIEHIPGLPKMRQRAPQSLRFAHPHNKDTPSTLGDNHHHPNPPHNQPNARHKRKEPGDGFEEDKSVAPTPGPARYPRVNQNIAVPGPSRLVQPRTQSHEYPPELGVSGPSHMIQQEYAPHMGRHPQEPYGYYGPRHGYAGPSPMLMYPPHAQAGYPVLSPNSMPAVPQLHHAPYGGYHGPHYNAAPQYPGRPY